MTVPVTTNRTDAVGNGAAKVYPFTFRILDEDEIVVVIADDEGVEFAPLTIATDYTVDGVDEEAGGTITLVDAGQDWLDGDGDLLADYSISILRIVSLAQNTDIKNQGPFHPEIHEDALDRLAMVDIQQQDEIDRSLKLPKTLTSADFDGELPGGIAGAANLVPMTNDDGDGWAPASEWPSGDAISSAAAEAAAAAASAASAEADAAAVLFRWGGAVGGTADAITLTPSTALAEYVAGIRYVFEATATNTGAATMAISGLAAKTIKTQSGAALVAGNIRSGTLYTITYDGTDLRLTDPVSSMFSIAVDQFSGDGADTTFVLSRDPGSENNIMVIVDGVETLLKDRSLSGTTLTFATAPPAGTNNINVFHIGVAVATGVPGDGTVTTDKLGDGSVTKVKLAESVLDVIPTYIGASAAGTAAYVANPSPAFTSYVTGMMVYFKADVANSSTATLNVSGLGAAALVDREGSALVGGELQAGQFLLAVYDGTSFRLVSVLSVSEIFLNTGNGYGSTNTAIRRFTNVVRNVGSSMTYADSAGDGMSVTINKAGLYIFTANDELASPIGISKNSAQLTTSIASITTADRLAISYPSGINNTASAAAPVFCSVADVIRAHGAAGGGAAGIAAFHALRIG